MSGALVFGASPAFAEPFANGSFEDPERGVNFFYEPVFSGQKIGSWTVTGDPSKGVDLLGALFASDGDQSIELAGSPGPGGVTQTFDTVAGYTYRVDYDIAKRDDCRDFAANVRVFVNGNQVDTFTFGPGAPERTFLLRTFTFTATGAQTTLAFDTTVADPDFDCGTILDNVRVSSGAPPVSKAAVVAGSVNWSLGTGLPDPSSTSSIDFAYGERPLVPLMGDWDGNGTITVGYYRNPNGRTAMPGDASFFLNNQNDSSAPEIVFPFFGDPRGYAVAGDYDGNGYDDVAVFRCGHWEIQYLDANGPIPGRAEFFRLEAPFSQACTWPAGVPVAGDWDGDGIDGIGTYDYVTGTWVLKNTVGFGGPDIGPFVFWGGAGTGSYPVVGDWNGDGIDTPGYRVGQTWTVRTESVTGGPTASFVFGVANSIPFTWSAPVQVGFFIN